MGKWKEEPKYNVISFRVSDREAVLIEQALAGRSKQQFIHEAITEKLNRKAA